MNWRRGKILENSSEHFNRIEKEWNITLPSELKKVISLHDGGRPPFEKSLFKTASGEERVFGGFLYFNLNKKGNALESYHSLKDRLPDKVFPFALDPGGNYICFDYKVLDGLGNPQVVFWNHEYKIDKDNDEEIHYEITFIASSFNEFLECLYDDYTA